MNDKQIRNELTTIILTKISKNQVVSRPLLVQEFMKKHPIPTEEILEDFAERDFYLHCGYAHVRALAEMEVRSFKLMESRPEDVSLFQDIKMEAYNLQRAYCIKRNDELVIVPIVLMSELECKEKEDQLVTMGDGCYRHADAMKQWRIQRFGDSSNPPSIQPPMVQ
jgi:hypothetical protein